MRASFERFLSQIKCVEVGVSGAKNATTMLEALPHAQFYLIDNYDVNSPTFQFGKVFSPEEMEVFIKDVQERLKPYGDRVHLLIEDSVEASKSFKDGYFDYIYIDGEHDENSVLRDLEAWYPKLKEGGTIGIHDAETPSVKRAWEKFFLRYEIKDTDWIFRKISI